MVFDLNLLSKIKGLSNADLNIPELYVYMTIVAPLAIFIARLLMPHTAKIYGPYGFATLLPDWLPLIDIDTHTGQTLLVGECEIFNSPIL